MICKSIPSRRLSVTLAQASATRIYITTEFTRPCTMLAVWWLLGFAISLVSCFDRQQRLYRNRRPFLGPLQRQSSSSCRGGAQDGNVVDGAGVQSRLVPNMKEPETWSSPKRAIILMDDFCAYHGGYVEKMAQQVYGVAVINVLSEYFVNFFAHYHPDETDAPTMAAPKDAAQLAEWMEAIQQRQPQLRIEAIVGLSDSGLPDAERFGDLLRLRKHNGFSESRRDKYLMNQAMQEANLPIVQQRLCRTLDEALEFTRGLMKQHASKTSATPSVTQTTTSGLLGSGKNLQDSEDNNDGEKCVVVVKPIRGVASESVYLCDSEESVREAFDAVWGSAVFGSPGEKHDTVLVQEFARGTEYAIDVVSRDGEHKVAALWRYDKRPANGAAFVYHATELVGGHTPEAEIVCEYTQQALDALGLKWGLTHNEVILTRQGPRLVEVNCRQHNMDFAPIAMACIGYNALDMLLSSYLFNNNGFQAQDDSMALAWDLLPDRPVTRAFGAMVHLVNHQKGKLVAVNTEGLTEMQEMESVLDMHVYPHFLEEGAEIAPTVDIRTDSGWVQLINDDQEAFQRDYNRIVELMPTLFVVEEESQ